MFVGGPILQTSLIACLFGSYLSFSLVSFISYRLKIPGNTFGKNVTRGCRLQYPDALDQMSEGIRYCAVSLHLGQKGGCLHLPPLQRHSFPLSQQVAPEIAPRVSQPFTAIQTQVSYFPCLQSSGFLVFSVFFFFFTVLVSFFIFIFY